ncbi:MAG: sigma-54 dependent transcriptional regulator, partial [bacterium]
MKEKIMIVDDEEDMLENCRRMLASLGYRDSVTMQDSEAAVILAEKEKPDLIITDLRMPKIDGIELLRRVKRLDENIIVIVFTGHASFPTAVEAIREGAFDYIPKPFTFDQFSFAVRRALTQKKLVNENIALKRQLDTPYIFKNIIGNSLPWQDVIETVKKIAKTDTNILLLGESGTGKELVARSIHHYSNRAEKPFLPVDCASLPESLLETELFGHEKGAFTGAYSSRPGLFEFANTGTFFLDEVVDLTLNIQTKLLRILQDRKCRRVGGRNFIDVDVRIISSTNRNIEEAVAQTKFREDLFYRLNVITIKLPPLRERKSDIELIANHYLKHYNKFTDKDIRTISKEAMEILTAYRWPGNVRELQNVVERAVSLIDSDTIGVDDLPEHIRQAPQEEDSMSSFYSDDVVPYKYAKKEWVKQSEKEYLMNILKRCEWNISRAAREAQVDRKTFYKLIKRHKIS